MAQCNIFTMARALAWFAGRSTAKNPISTCIVKFGTCARVVLKMDQCTGMTAMIYRRLAARADHHPKGMLTYLNAYVDRIGNQSRWH